jgi:hypothetical protein
MRQALEKIAEQCLNLHFDTRWSDRNYGTLLVENHSNYDRHSRGPVVHGL